MIHRVCTVTMLCHTSEILELLKKHVRVKTDCEAGS